MRVAYRVCFGRKRVPAMFGEAIPATSPRTRVLQDLKVDPCRPPASPMRRGRRLHPNWENAAYSKARWAASNINPDESRHLPRICSASASGSAGPSRLAKSSAATSARASRSRRKALARTASAALLMTSILRWDLPPSKRWGYFARPWIPSATIAMLDELWHVSWPAGDDRRQ